eukprot:gene575-1107_t
MELENLPRALPLITVDDISGRFTVHDESLNLLRQFSKPNIAIVAVCGLYRTGKSYLLNVLLQQSGGTGCFTVGSSINACTKGIWIWNTPKYDPDKDQYVFFLDTEGLGSTFRTSTYDSRIFALGLLLSSYFIYNSRGVIDGQALDDLSLVANLTRMIQVRAGYDEQDGGESLSQYFPSFLWIVRDFALKLQQENGRIISSKEYLENCLKPQPGFSESVVTKNHTRALISSFFPDRDCVTLVRPAEDEAMLKNLSQHPLTDLRPEFQTQVKDLLSKVAASVKPKQMQGRPLSGGMIASLVLTYVEALNSGTIPVISTAWERVLSDQCGEAKAVAMRHYNNTMTQTLSGHVREQSNVTLSGGGEGGGGDISSATNHLYSLLPIPRTVLLQCHGEAKSAAKDYYWSKMIERNDDTVMSTAKELKEYLRKQLALTIAENIRRSDIEVERRISQRVATHEITDEQPTSDPFSSTSSLSSSSVVSSFTSTIKNRCNLNNDFMRSIEDMAHIERELEGVASSKVVNKYLLGTALDELSGWASSVAELFRSKEAELQNDFEAVEQKIAQSKGRLEMKEAILQQQLKSLNWSRSELEERIKEENERFELETNRRVVESTRYATMIEDITTMHMDTVHSLQKRQEELRKRLREEREVVCSEESKLHSDTAALQDEHGSIQERRRLERQELEHRVMAQESLVADMKRQLEAMTDEHEMHMRQKQTEYSRMLEEEHMALRQERETLQMTILAEKDKEESRQMEELAVCDALISKKMAEIKELEALGVEYEASEGSTNTSSEGSKSLSTGSKGRVKVNKNKSLGRSISSKWK